MDPFLQLPSHRRFAIDTRSTRHSLIVDRPLEPLRRSMLAFCCGAFFLSYLGFRFTVRSTIDDLPEMRRWKQGRVAIAAAMVIGNFMCAALAWRSPWIGYGGAVATVIVFLL